MKGPVLGGTWLKNKGTAKQVVKRSRAFHRTILEAKMVKTPYTREEQLRRIAESL